MNTSKYRPPHNYLRWLRQISIAVFTFFITASSVNASIDFCWKDSYGRGVGTIPNTCASGLQKEGALCYEPCKTGYESSTLGACLQKCTNGFTDQGLFCRKAEYHVSEYPWQFGDALNDSGMYKRCESKHGSGKCWKPLLVVVEKCKAGYEHILGFCRPKTTPNCKAMGYAGQFDLSCTKDTYFKTPIAARCASNKEYDAGLCYKKCANGSDGVGPVCWSNCTANTLPTECGAGCASDETACGMQTTNLVMSVLDSAVSIATTIGTMGVATAIKQTTLSTTKAALKEGGKATVRQMAKHAGKISKGVALETAKQQIQGIVVKNGFEYTAAGASAVGNGMSLFSNISDISNGNYESEEQRDFMIAQEVLNNVSLLDPSGIVGIVAAYTKPKCSVLAKGEVPQDSHAGVTDTYLAEYEMFYSLLNARVGIAQMKLNDIEQEMHANTEAQSTLTFPFAMNNIKRKGELKGQQKTIYASLQEGNLSSSEEAYVRNIIRETSKEIAELEKDYPLITEGISPSLPKDIVDMIKELKKTDYYAAYKASKAELAAAKRKLNSAKTLFIEIVKKRNTQAFWALSAGSGYAEGLDYNSAKAYCESNSGQLATKQQLIEANKNRSFSMCASGWLADGSTGYVMVGNHAGCGRDGFNSSGFPAKTSKKVSYCVGPTLPIDANVQPKKVTAAMTIGSGYATYLFYADGTYAKTSNKRSIGFDTGYPRKMPGGWVGIPANWNSSIDAAMPYQTTAKGYMWRDGQYLRLNGVTKDNGFPSNMPGGWVNMPASWNGNVDAAISYKSNNKHYLFKGDEYVRMTGVKVDAGYPQKLSKGWIGLPADFVSDIDAATYINGHVYMIKGQRYIRFTNTTVDAGYPKPMSNWPQ